MSIEVKFDFKKYKESISTILSKVTIWHVLLISLALHLLLLSTPTDGFVFDESYYVPISRVTLQGQPANIEHTFLSKIIIAASIAIFGDYWFAWRIPIVVTCLVSIFFLYKLAKLFMTEKQSLFAASFLAFDTMYFTHGSIFVLDMPALMFGIIAIYFYFSKRYKLSALNFGLSFLSKELGLFFLIGVGFYELFQRIRIPRGFRVTVDTGQLKKFGAFVLIFSLVSLGGLQSYIWVFKPYSSNQVNISAQVIVSVDQDGIPISTTTQLTTNSVPIYVNNPYEYLRFEFDYFYGLAPTVSGTSDKDLRQPLSWVLPLQNWDNPPILYGVSIGSPNYNGYITRYASAETPTIEFMFFPIIAVSIFAFVKRKNIDRKTLLLVFSLMGASYFPWLLEQVMIPSLRMTFNYYLLYTIPAICLGIPLFWKQLFKSESRQHTALTLQLAVTVIYFALYYPLVLVR